jgi:hypothetical protein
VRIAGRGFAFAVALVAAMGLAGLSASTSAPEPELPALGTVLGELPEGKMKVLADQACLHCHSADMIRQQRLNEKQWTAEIKKMTGWGAAVPEDQQAELVAYLVEHFGPDNDRFQPVATQSLGR